METEIKKLTQFHDDDLDDCDDEPDFWFEWVKNSR